jgi:hypothetical protein
MTRQTLSEELFFDPAFTSLSDDTARLILIGLILTADKNNGGCADVHVLARKLDEPDYFVENALQEMSKKGLIHLQEVHGRRYYQVCNWRKYVPRSHPPASVRPKPTPAAPSLNAASHPGSENRKAQHEHEHPEEPHSANQSVKRQA